MTTRMSTQEHAAQIRTELKALGIKARAVSVRCDLYSMGSSIYVTIKDPAVKLDTVQAIAGKAEHIDRDEMSGEILSGGNCFVKVSYADELLATLAAPIVDAVKDLEPGEIVELAGEQCYRDAHDPDYWRTFGRGDETGLYCWSASFFGERLVELALNRGELATLGLPAVEPSPEARRVAFRVVA